MRSPMPAMRKADGPMSTPRRLPPRSRGTPIRWTERIRVVNPRIFSYSNSPDAQEAGGRRRGGPPVGDAVGDAGAAEAAAGHVHAGVARDGAVDRRHAIEVPDFVLRVGARPPEDPREQRLPGDAEQGRERAH